VPVPIFLPYFPDLKMTRKLGGTPLLLLVLVLVGQATLLSQRLDQPADIRQLIDQSTIVFVGKCVETKSRWDDAARLILTDSTFEVTDYLKGDGETRITITEPGGTLPERNMTMTVPGMAQFRKDEEVVVFTRTLNKLNRVVGGSQGKRMINTEDGTGSKRVGTKSLKDFLEELRAIISEPLQPVGQ
jgi:hypothetical protein